MLKDRVRKSILFLRRYTLQSRIKIAFLLLLFISVSLIGGISYGISYKILKKNTTAYSLNNVNNIKKNVDAILNDYLQIANNVATDIDVINYVQEYEKLNSIERNKYYQSIYKKINYNNRNFESLISIEILSNHKLLLRTPYQITSDNVRESDIFTQIKNNSNRVVILGIKDVEYNAYEHDKTKVIVISVKIKSLRDGQNIGFVNVAFSENGLYSTYNDFINNTGDNIFIIDNDGKVISHSNKSTLGKDLYSDINKKILEGGKRLSFYERKGRERRSLVAYSISNITNWRVIYEVDHQKLFAPVNKMKDFIFASVILCILIIGILSHVVARSITYPLNDVIQSIQSFEKNNFETTVHDGAEDEIGYLAQTFNEMVKRIKRLMQENHYIKLRQQEAKFMVLQAQINPHFLYNTLDMINWTAYMKGNNDICDMVNSLSGFFRMSLSKNTNIVPISEEIEHVKYYTTIQKFRYKDKINFYYEIDERLLDYITVRFILQPLVENAIYHGIEPKGGTGNIHIIVSDFKDKIIIKVIDDGIGVDNLDNIFEIYDNDKYGNKGFGVNNVNDRIKMVFGEGCGLFFEKNCKGGLVAKVIIKKQKRGRKTDEDTAC